MIESDCLAGPRRDRGWGAWLLAMAAAVCLASPSQAYDFQVHGFAAQGGLLSDGNNLFGGSVHGTLDFYEYGVNATVNVGHHLLFSGQVLDRAAGATDTGRPRLDYALADYRFISTDRSSFGVRGGRVRDPIGFYNDTRDVIFTRPSILMPSMYYDTTGLRSLLFSSDGLQVYGSTTIGTQEVSAVAGYIIPFNLSGLEKRILLGNDIPTDIRISQFFLGRIQDDIDEGTWKVAASYLHGKIALNPNANVPVSSDLFVEMYIASLRYNARQFSLTGEYQLVPSRGSGPLVGSPMDSESMYLQGDYRFYPHWTVYARYDLSFADRKDRDGGAFQAATGADRNQRYSKDAMLGLKWLSEEHWGVWAEYHVINGSETVSGLDNQHRVIANHWSVFTLMGAFRF